MPGNKKALYLIDAYGLIYRSYFAFLSRPLRNAAGRNVSALFGFSRTLISLLCEGAPAFDGRGKLLAERQRPGRLAAVFDSRTPTFRHKMYAEYKATRQKAPEDLHEQVPLVEEVLNALGVPVLRVDGYEADDIIATLAGMARAEGRQCYIISSDKDLLQLVGGGAWELRPVKPARAGQGGDPPSQAPSGTVGGFPFELVGPQEVKLEWQVAPEKMLDLLSLTGDSSDNVPGVRGIGEKTAVKLMARYGSLDGIYENLAGIEGSTGKKLAEGKKDAFFSRDLIRLENKVPLPLADIEELSVENIDRAGGAAVLMREGIRQAARTLDPGIKDTSPAPSVTPPGDAASPEGPKAGERPAMPPPPSSLLGEGVYRIVSGMKELEKIFALAKKQKFLALDFETDSLDAWNSRPIGISFSLKPKEAFYAPVAAHGLPFPGAAAENTGAKSAAKEGGAEGDFLDPVEVRSLLAPLLDDPSMTIAAHNAKYDYKVSRGWGIPEWKCRIWDTMVAAWVDDPERNNYSLDSLAGHHFDYTPITYNDVVPKGGTFDMVDLKTACRYSAEDADLTVRLKEYLEPRLKETGSLSLFLNMEMPLLPILAEMEGAGIRIESARLKNYGKEMFDEMNRVQAEAWKTVGHEFNLGSPKQLQEVLFRERKLRPGKKTKTGYSTDVDVLEDLAREDPVPALILRHRTLAKLRSTYVDALVDTADREGRIHTSFVQTGTATGRLSSREPNLQNIPIREEEGRRIREAFAARPGSLLVSADYSQIELVILAHLSEDRELCAAFREGKDVHARTAALIFGVKEEDVRGDQRRIAKTINFGVMYGMSAFRLANELGLSRTAAAAFIDAYFKTYWGVSRFIGELIQQAEEKGYASTISGRRRYIRTINSRNKTEKAAAERVAVNTPIQGSAADIVKTAMIKLDGALKAAKSPARLLLQVHDELILECPKEAAEAAAKLAREVMENAVSLRVPLRVSVETGKRWGDFH
ncbi:MAG: DNA polymerase I [Treponema sp.]|jgi:DNA polymerase-1|nr:DNA polymerase I [Treponema sp.]